MTGFPKKKRIKNRKLLDTFQNTPCVACGKPSEPAHIKSKGSGGDDVEDGILSLCHEHHMIQHSCGWVYLCATNRKVYLALKKKGWTFSEFDKLVKI